MVLVANMPKPRKHQEEDRIGHDGVRDGEEGDRAGAKGERWNGNECVGGIEVAADEEPGDHRAEAPAAKAPFVELVEIAFAPIGGGKAEPGNKGKQQHEDRKSDPVHVLHDIPRQYGSLWSSDGLKRR